MESNIKIVRKSLYADDSNMYDLMCTIPNAQNDRGVLLGRLIEAMEGQDDELACRLGKQFGIAQNVEEVILLEAASLGRYVINDGSALGL
jgi:hypothetical protein